MIKQRYYFANDKINNMGKSTIEDERELLKIELQTVGFSEAAVREICWKTDSMDEYIIYPFAMVDGDTPVEVTAHLDVCPPNYTFHLTHFEVRLGRYSKARVTTNTFSCHPAYAVNVREAINLMEERSVYRSPTIDPLRRGYWIKLDDSGLVSGYRCLDFNRNGFRVESGLKTAGIWELLDEERRAELVRALERGDRMQLSLGEGQHRQTYRLELDDYCEKLVVKDPEGYSMDLPLMLSTQHPDNGQEKD